MASDLTSPALTDIAAERARQTTSEGWTHEHDDRHAAGTMARASACYALHAAGVYHSELSWLWPSDWEFKSKGHRRDLVRAAALLVAEIERLDRVQP